MPIEVLPLTEEEYAHNAVLSMNDENIISYIWNAEMTGWSLPRIEHGVKSYIKKYPEKEEEATAALKMMKDRLEDRLEAAASGMTLRVRLIVNGGERINGPTINITGTETQENIKQIIEEIWGGYDIEMMILNGTNLDGGKFKFELGENDLVAVVKKSDPPAYVEPPAAKEKVIGGKSLKRRRSQKRTKRINRKRSKRSRTKRSRTKRSRTKRSKRKRNTRRR